MSILVIEDDPELSAEIASYLRRRGRIVAACNSLRDAREFLDRALTVNAPPKAILCDVNLPDGSGFELCREYCRRLPDTRWVIMSGDNDPAAVPGDIVSIVDPPTLVEKPIRLRDLDQLMGNA